MEISKYIAGDQIAWWFPTPRVSLRLTQDGIKHVLCWVWNPHIVVQNWNGGCFSLMQEIFTAKYTLSWVLSVCSDLELWGEKTRNKRKNMSSGLEVRYLVRLEICNFWCMCAVVSVQRCPQQAQEEEVEAVYYPVSIWPWRDLYHMTSIVLSRSMFNWWSAGGSNACLARFSNPCLCSAAKPASSILHLLTWHNAWRCYFFLFFTSIHQPVDLLVYLCVSCDSLLDMVDSLLYSFCRVRDLHQYVFSYWLWFEVVCVPRIILSCGVICQ